MTPKPPTASRMISRSSAQEDPVEAVVPTIPIVLPAVGAA